MSEGQEAITYRSSPKHLRGCSSPSRPVVLYVWCTLIMILYIAILMSLGMTIGQVWIRDPQVSDPTRTGWGRSEISPTGLEFRDLTPGMAGAR